MTSACLLFTAFLAASQPEVKVEAKPEIKARTDSLRSLQLILSSEFESGGKVLKLEDGKLADSLTRIPTPGAFYEKLKDTTLARDYSRKAEFAAYWNRVQKENGYQALQGQLAAHDVDKSRIPKVYLFDSSVVVYPGWIILRRKGR